MLNLKQIKSKTTAVAVVSMLALAGCEDPAPIKIGFVGGLSGRSADVSQASRNAVQMAIDEANADGGIHGRMLEFVVKDNEGNPETAGQNVRDLAAEGVAAIVGPNLSSTAGGMLPAINETGVVTVSPTASSMVLAGLDDPMFRMNSTTGQNASAYAKHHYDNGGRRVTAAFDLRNRSFSESWLQEFTTAFAALGGEVIGSAPFDAEAASGYAAIVPTLLAGDPDAILLVSNGVDTAQIAQQVRKVGSDLPLIAAEWAATEQLIELGGKSVEGLVILQTYDRDNTDPNYVRFRDAYQDRFKSMPGYSSIAGYDAAQVLIAALRNQKDGQSLKQTLLTQGPVQGLQQELVFDATGDSTRKQVFVQIRNGKFVVK